MSDKYIVEYNMLRYYVLVLSSPWVVLWSLIIWHIFFSTGCGRKRQDANFANIGGYEQGVPLPILYRALRVAAAARAGMPEKLSPEIAAFPRRPLVY